MSRKQLGLLALAVIGLLCHAAAQTILNLPLDTIALPPGFTIDLYTTTPVPNARTLVLSDDTSNGTIVYVSTQGRSNVRHQPFLFHACFTLCKLCAPSDAGIRSDRCR